MDNEALRINILPRLRREVFYVYDWSTSKELPQFLKDRIRDLIDKFGTPLLEHCFLEWKKENLQTLQ